MSAVLARRRWSLGYAVLTGVTVAVLGWALASVGDVADAVRTTAAIWTQPGLLATFVVTYSAAFLLRAIAWRVLMSKEQQRPGVARLFGILQVALLANHVFPTKVGEVARVVMVTRVGVPLSTAASSTVIARVLDLASLCALAVIGTAIAGGGGLGLLPALTLPVALMVLTVGALLVLSRQRIVSGPLPDSWPRAFAITLPSWALEAVALWTVARAADVELSFAVAVAATAFTIAFQGFQVTPGGIGLYETSLTAALAVFGMDPATALALAVATHAMKFVYAFAFGLPAAIFEAAPERVIHYVKRDGFALAAALTVGGLLAQVGPAQWLLGVLAALPLMLLMKCHHLPRQLLPVRLSGGVGLIAWCVVLSLGVVAGAHRPGEFAVFGMTALLGVVVGRQWWLSRTPIAAPAPLAPNAKVAIVIPVHDEASTLPRVLAQVPRDELQRRSVLAHVIVVDDGSQDDSAALARRAGAEDVISHPRRLGLGAALRTGLLAARESGAEAVVYLDGDGEYDPRDIPGVLDPVLNGTADYVLGVRFPAASHSMYPTRRIGNRLFTALQCVLTGRRLRDGQTGFRALGPRALATAEIVHDYNYAQVLTLDLLRKQLRLAEVPITYQVRQTGRSFIRYHEYALRVLPAIARELLSA